MAIYPTEELTPHPVVKDTLSREERCDQYRALARAILELAWRDARPGTVCSEEYRRAAREFLFSEDAEFWAYVAGVNIAQIRRALRCAELETEACAFREEYQ